MTIEATASALAADEAMAAPEVSENAEVSEDQHLSELFDTLTAEEEPEQDATTDQPEAAPDDAQEEPAEPDDTDQPDDPPVEVPSGLPAALKDAWGDMSEAARTAVLQDRDGLHRKLSDMGRQVQGIGPIRDVLVEMTQKLPAMADMRPEDAAREIMQLAEISQKFNDDPVNTMLGLVKQHGLEQALAQALTGQEVTQGARGSAALQQEITSLKRQLAQVSDPEYIRQHVQQFTTADRVQSDVQQFAATAEHWQAVEDDLPQFIPLARAKLGEGTAPGAVLEAAYKMALKINDLDTQAPPPPADEAKATTDPERTKAAIQAKSVNVSGKSTGKARTLSEDEELAAAYVRAQNR